MLKSVSVRGCSDQVSFQHDFVLTFNHGVVKINSRHRLNSFRIQSMFQRLNSMHDRLAVIEQSPEGFCLVKGGPYSIVHYVHCTIETFDASS